MYLDRRLWELTRGHRGAILVGTLMGLAALAAGIARFAFLGAFLARVLQGASLSGLWSLALATGVAVLLRALLDDTRTRLAHRTAAIVQAKLRLQLFDRIPELGPAWFGGQRSGGIMLTVIDGVEQLQTFFGQYLPQLATAACAPLAIFVFMAWWTCRSLPSCLPLRWSRCWPRW